MEGHPARATHTPAATCKPASWATGAQTVRPLSDTCTMSVYVQGAAAEPTFMAASDRDVIPQVRPGFIDS